jgi:hypothetical protein
MEKDGAQWKGKWENANRALLEMAEEVLHLFYKKYNGPFVF